MQLRKRTIIKKMKVHPKAAKRRECLQKGSRSLRSFATRSAEGMKRTAKEFTTQTVIMKPLRVLRSLKGLKISQHTS